MVLEDLVVQGLRWFHSRRHGGSGMGSVAQELQSQSQSQSRRRILRESQESERDSARAAIGLNEAQVELKWQRQSQEQKLQGRCSEPGQRWPIHRMTGRVMTVSAGTAVPLWLQCDRTHRELVLSCCAMPRMRVIYSIHVLLEVATKHCLSSSSEPRQQ
jgi:hypothetical protein